MAKVKVKAILPSLDRVMAAVKTSMFGSEYVAFCLACGDEVYGMEPDTRSGTCEGCGKKAVFAAEELLVRMVG